MCCHFCSCCFRPILPRYYSDSFTPKLPSCRGAASAGWLHSRQGSFCRGPSLGFLLVFEALLLCPLICPFCSPCCLHGGALTVCCFFFLCVSSASAVGASRPGCTGLRTSQAWSCGCQACTASCDTRKAFASVGASRCASPLPLSGFVAGGLRPALVAPPALRRLLAERACKLQRGETINSLQQTFDQVTHCNVEDMSCQNTWRNSIIFDQALCLNRCKPSWFIPTAVYSCLHACTAMASCLDVNSLKIIHLHGHFAG